MRNRETRARTLDALASPGARNVFFRLALHVIKQFELNTRRGNDPPDVYATTADGPAQTREGYRIVWYRSAQKAELDDQFREAALEKAHAELFDLDSRLNHGHLSTRSAIRNDIKAILRQWKCQESLTVRLGSRTRIQHKRLRRGRPRREDPILEVRTPVFHLELQRDAAALRAAARTDGVFPLVTNLAPRRAAPRRRRFFGSTSTRPTSRSGMPC